MMNEKKREMNNKVPFGLISKNIDIMHRNISGWKMYPNECHWNEMSILLMQADSM